ncbi:MAG: hypothetical protein AAFR61_21370 [Bacteroidota bacterium]
MKYFEYLYATLAVMAMIFLVTEYDRMTTNTMIPLLIAMVLFGFMFSYRRRRRIAFEKELEEDMRKLEEEIAKDPEV